MRGPRLGDRGEVIVNRHRKALVVSMFVAFVLFASAVPSAALTWQRIGRGGFDGPYSPLQQNPNVMAIFNGKLYVGSSAWGSGGGRIWRYDGHAWALVHKPKWGNPRIAAVTALAVFGDYLYAGMSLNNSSCEVWRTKGTGKPPYQWTKVSDTTNIGKSGTYEVPSMTVIKGLLYVGARSYLGCQIWTYNGSAWNQIVGQGPSGSPTGPGFGNKENYSDSGRVRSTPGAATCSFSTGNSRPA